MNGLSVRFRSIGLQTPYIALYRYDGRMAVILAVRHQKEAGY